MNLAQHRRALYLEQLRLMYHWPLVPLLGGYGHNHRRGLLYPYCAPAWNHPSLAQILALWHGIRRLHDAGAIYGDLAPRHVCCPNNSSTFQQIVLIDLETIQVSAPNQHAYWKDEEGTKRYSPRWSAPERKWTGATIATDLFALGRMMLEAGSERFPLIRLEWLGLSGLTSADPECRIDTAIKMDTTLPAEENCSR